MGGSLIACLVGVQYLATVNIQGASSLSSPSGPAELQQTV